MENFKSHIKSRKLDFIGIIASTVCIIHCLLTPLVVILFSEVVKEKYEYINFLFLAISLVSVVLSVKTTNHQVIKVLLIYFWIQLSVGLLFEELNFVFSILMYFAAVGLIATHIWNIKYCKKC